MTITRYDYTTSYGAAVMEEDEDGEYVSYADHVAALSAIRAEQARPSVRPLEWVHSVKEVFSDGSGVLHCRCYIAAMEKVLAITEDHKGAFMVSEMPLEYPTLEAAKAAAQADYSQRILSALAPSTTTEREEAIRECVAVVDFDFYHPELAKSLREAMLALLDKEVEASIRAEQARPSEPVAWLHPTANWCSVDKNAISMRCLKDGPGPIPLYAALTPAPEPSGEPTELATRLAEYKDNPHHVDPMSERFKSLLNDILCYLRAPSTTTEEHLRDIVRAWEALPGGQQQPMRAVEKWLADEMAPSINRIRALLEGDR